MLRIKNEAELISKCQMMLDPQDSRKLIPLQHPTPEMPVTQLVGFVQMMFEAILAARKVTAVHYWWAGESLKLIREQRGIEHGRWKKHVVQELKLNWPMVRTAQRIRKKHIRPEDCTGKTLRQAEAYRPRRSRRDGDGNDDPKSTTARQPKPPKRGGNRPPHDAPQRKVDKQEASTPRWLFDYCNQMVTTICGKGFAKDLAAAEWNAKCDQFFTREDDALRQDWGDGPNWVNPPFTNEFIDAVVTRAIAEKEQRGSTTVALLPHWHGYDYADACEEHGRIHRIKGPVIFTRQDGTTFPMNFGWTTTSLVVVVFSPHMQPGFGRPIRKGDTPEEEDRNGAGSTACYGSRSNVRDTAHDEPNRPPAAISLAPEEYQRRDNATHLIHGDCVEKLTFVERASVDLCLFSPPHPEIMGPYGRWTEDEWHTHMMEVVVRCRHVLKPSGSIVAIIYPNKERVGKMRMWPYQFIYWAATGFGPDWGLIQNHFIDISSVKCDWNDERALAPMHRAVGMSVWVGPPDCYRRPDNVFGGAPVDPAALSAAACRDNASRVPLFEKFSFTPYNLLSVGADGSADGPEYSTPMPYKLAKRWCQYLLPPGGVLCDPFCGPAGTTLSAALDCGASKVIGIDLNVDCLDIARRRILHDPEPDRPRAEAG